MRFNKFTERDYQHFVKFGYDPTGSIIRSRRKEIDAVIAKNRDPIIPNDAWIAVSGGIDSSGLLVTLMERYQDWRPTILTMENDEDAHYFDILFDSLDTRRINKVIKVLVPKEHTSKQLYTIMRAQKSPMDLGSMIPNYYLFKAARGRTLITGDGADEIFGGYARNEYYNCVETDQFEELCYYHIPRVVNMAFRFRVNLICPYLSYFGDTAYSKPGKPYLKELYKEVLPQEIINRVKTPLKSEDAKQGIPHRAKLVQIWKEYRGKRKSARQSS